MKIRNKKTGLIISKPDGVFLRGEGFDRKYHYDSFAEMLEEWEDYKPAKPLIKDPKIRKAVRAWAEACELSSVLVYRSFFDTFLTLKSGVKIISFQVETPKKLKFGKTYTITEICGEEE